MTLWYYSRRNYYITVDEIYYRVMTTIEVEDETWSRLNGRKQRPGESFDDVVNRLLDETAPEAEA